jgi:hypothetical protein
MEAEGRRWVGRDWRMVWVIGMKLGGLGNRIQAREDRRRRTR